VLYFVDYIDQILPVVKYAVSFWNLMLVVVLCYFSDRLRSHSMENVGKLQISPDKVR